MKILIGTPIHQSKDYAMKRWLENVAKLQKVTPADLLLVDNSPNLKYIEKIKNYCIKYKIENYTIEHFEFSQGMTSGKIEIRVQRAKDMIRRRVLAKDYEAWFSWECDVLLPVDALSKLMKIMKSGNFMKVSHNCWNRKLPGNPNFGMGCALIKRECLNIKKIRYIYERKEKTGLEIAGDWLEDLVQKKILQNGGSFVLVENIVHPIYHLHK